MFTEVELKTASALLESEMTFIIKAMDHSQVSQDSYFDTWQLVQKDFIWVPSKNKYERAASATNTERIESIKAGLRISQDLRCRTFFTNFSSQADYDAARSEMEREAKRAAKVNDKVNVLVGGLQQRDLTMRTKLAELVDHLQSAEMELTCFQSLKERELNTAPERISKARELVLKQRERESDLQLQFKRLGNERDELVNGL